MGKSYGHASICHDHMDDTDRFIEKCSFCDNKRAENYFSINGDSYCEICLAESAAKIARKIVDVFDVTGGFPELTKEDFFIMQSALENADCLIK